jgi:hypothetical protein
MSNRPQTGSRRGASRQFSKSAREKKAKEKKQLERQNGIKYAEEETQVSPKEVVDKAVAGLGRLGNQVFALSPYSQYYDDWLVVLRQTISEFESSSVIAVDEQFTKERTQTFQDVEASFAEQRIQESNLSGQAKELADNNHLLVETDKTYAEQTRELSRKRNSEVQRLGEKIRELEPEVERQQAIKVSFFKIGERRRVAQQLEQAQRDLKNAKNEMEVALQTFTQEQDKLHDNYQKRKQEITEKVDALHKELEKHESDPSIPARQTACTSLTTSIKSQVDRMPPIA